LRGLGKYCKFIGGSKDGDTLWVAELIQYLRYPKYLKPYKLSPDANRTEIKLEIETYRKVRYMWPTEYGGALTFYQYELIKGNTNE